MDERMHAVHDHITRLHHEAAAERAARAAVATSGASGGGERTGFVTALRRRAGRALVALGALVEGPTDCEACPEGLAAARS
jgi:hypothetical protein